MKLEKHLLNFFLLLTCGICNSQNLIPNGDFEQNVGCPAGLSQIQETIVWFKPSLGTPDYYNQCAIVSNNVSVPINFYMLGFQYAHSGIAYSGVYNWAGPEPEYREYIEVTLDSSLSSNVCYHFEMYINLNNGGKYTSYNIGAYFSDSVIYDSINTALPFSPQINNTSGNLPDTLNWTLVSGNYTAHGGESYLIIGNFQNDSNTSISIVNPSASNNFSYVYIDDVSLVRCSSLGMSNYNNDININVFPNPITDKLTINIDYNEPTEISLYDITSRKLLQQTFTNSTTVNTEQLAKGIYLYEVRNKNGVIKNGKVIKR